MSIYRQVHVSFWQDAFVLDLTPEEKYFYIYLMTNSKTSQVGIYELPMRVLEMETGYNRETVEKLLQRFIDYGKIEYNPPTREVFMKNWAKFNWNNSPKVVKRVEAELAEVKFEPFIKEYLEIVDAIKSDTVSIQYAKSMDTKRTNNKNNKKNNNNDFIYTLFNYWNEQEIIKHRKMNQAMESHINARLEEYSVDELKKAISNYKEILTSSDYYWTHKWSLQDFMKPNNVTRFVDEADPMNNFKSDKNNSDVNSNRKVARF